MVGEIKKDGEEDINIGPNGLKMVSDREFVNTSDEPKREQDCLYEDLNGDRSIADEAGYAEEKDASYSLYHFEKVLNNEVCIESNSSDVSGFQVLTNGIESKEKDRYEFLAEILRRTGIAESHKAKLTIEKVEEVDPYDSTLNPLEVVEEIVLKLYDFIDHIFLMLKDGHRVEFQLQDRVNLLDGADHLLETLSQRICSVNDGMEDMKNDENHKEDYSHTKTHIPQIFNKLLEIIAFLVERSFDLGIASLLHQECTENELSSCAEELNQSKEKLGVIISRIRELKAKKMDTFWELDKGDGHATDEFEKLKQICKHSYAVPRFTGGFER